MATKKMEFRFDSLALYVAQLSSQQNQLINQTTDGSRTDSYLSDSMGCIRSSTASTAILVSLSRVADSVGSRSTPAICVVL